MWTSESEAYESFAQVYDLFMDNVPYDQWAEYLCKILKEYEIKDGLVLDLGCGTGSMTERLATAGYDMIGIDCSVQMLEAAAIKREKSGHDILYLLQDMREFELYGTVRAVISVCDSLNYITETKELVQVFRLVNNYLDPGGIFLFDFNTDYKYREILGDRTIAEEREMCSFIWDNYYYEDEGINEYVLTLFLRQEALSKSCGQELFRKFTETHFQKGYTLEQIKEALLEAGMEFLAAYDGFTKKKPGADSERIFVAARESGKSRENKT